MSEGDTERLYQFIENTRETAEKIEERSESGEILNADHGNGVAAGLRWAADELESVLEDERSLHTGTDDGEVSR